MAQQACVPDPYAKDRDPRKQWSPPPVQPRWVPKADGSAHRPHAVRSENLAREAARHDAVEVAAEALELEQVTSDTVTRAGLRKIVLDEAVTHLARENVEHLQRLDTLAGAAPAAGAGWLRLRHAGSAA